MPRDWPELFILDEEGAGPAGGGAGGGGGAGAGAAGEGEGGEDGERRAGFFSRLRESLSKTRQALTSEIHATLAETLEGADWERLEEALILADVGAPATAEVVGRLEADAR